MDFITSLPPSQGYTVIFVVVDRFAKGAHFGALPFHFSAHKVAILFLDMVCKLHDLPHSIVSDRDPIFISRFWQELFTKCGTKLRMSTSYHPQTDGQTEVLNRTLEQYLRCFVHKTPTKWFSYLSLAEWCYNTSIHSSTGVTPFEATYGYPPPTIPQYLLGSSCVDVVDYLLSSRQDLWNLIHKRLMKTQSAMNTHADAKRRDVSYQVNDWVYVKLHPYRQTSLTNTKYHKLTKRYYGPFQIVERIGVVAYRLDLPSNSRIHNVFHCSLLKPHHGPVVTSPIPLPPNAIDHHPLIEPLNILDSKWSTSISPPSLLVLVQWNGLAPEDTTWEPWHDLRAIFHLEDKVSLPAEDIDRIPQQPLQARPKRNMQRPTYLLDYIEETAKNR